MTIGKIAIARRLLDEAIRGAIRGDDPLTVHLGTLSAFSVTKDLRVHRELGQSAIEHLIREEARPEFWRAFFRLNNAIKHANQDPDGLVDVGQIERRTEIVIILTIENLKALEPETPPGFWAAYFWHQFTQAHPGSIDQETPEGFREAVQQVWEQVDHAEIVRLARAPHAEVAEMIAVAAALQHVAQIYRQ